MLRICVNSQTPLLRFKYPYRGDDQSSGPPLPLSMFKENEEYEFTPGGVSRMLYGLLKEMRGVGLASDICWVSLNPAAPRKIALDGMTLFHIHLPEHHLRKYGIMKEKIWRVFHGLSRGNISVSEALSSEEFRSYEFYNERCSEAMLELDREVGFDVFYIHDFQQLLVGRKLGKVKAKVFRWHIPLDEQIIPTDWRALLMDSLKHYDALIISTQRTLEALLKMGYSGRIHKIYPYVDPREYREPTEREVERFCNKFEIGPDDKVVLVVARMDPMKGQDKVLKAISKIIKRIPSIKVLLVGDGSFSSSRWGLSLLKGERWRAKLEGIVKRLGIQDHVIFSGYLSQEDLEAAYVRCNVNVLPSRREGFGLSVIEGWIYKKPAIVSVNAGVAELIRDGENGMLFRPEDTEELADRLRKVLTNDELSYELGMKGHLSSRKCYIQTALKEEYLIMNELIL